MTGWRIGDLLAVRRDDVDLEKATALSRAENNKGKRDDRVGLALEAIPGIPRFHRGRLPSTGSGSRSAVS
jgi:integrase